MIAYETIFWIGVACFAGGSLVLTRARTTAWEGIGSAGILTGTIFCGVSLLILIAAATFS